MTVRDTLESMTQAVSVRLDEHALQALGQLEATGIEPIGRNP